MTVAELVEAADFCDLIEVVVRKGGHGMWIQGYRIGKKAVIYPSEYFAENIELKSLKAYSVGDNRYPKTTFLNEGDVVNVSKYTNGELPMKVFCRDVHAKLPEDVARLEVCHFQPRNIPIFHGEALTHNEFSMDIWCYEDGYIPRPIIDVKQAEPKMLEGQMCIEDWGGAE